jgi:predicted kinase
MTILIHLVGPQGSGKSTLMRRIVDAAPGLALVHVDAELAMALTNRELRRAHHAASHVFVEASAMGARHADLAAGDRVLVVDEQLHRDWHLIWPDLIGTEGAPAVPEAATGEVPHAA